MCDKPFPSFPDIIEILIDGKKEIACISPLFTYVTGECSGYYKFISGDCYTSYNGILFIGKNNRLYFSEPFYQKSLSENGAVFGEIVLDESYGNIVDFAETTEGLLIFCTKKIVKLKPFGDITDYSMTAISDLNGIEKNSVKKVNDRVYFINDGKLYCYKDGVKKVNSLLDDKDFLTLDKACSFNDFYAIKTEMENNEYVFLINEEEQLFIKADGYVLDDGGRVFNTVNNKTARIKIGNGVFTYITKKFSVDGFITGFYGEFSAVSTVKISGDFGEKEFTANGVFFIPLCLKTKYAVIKITAQNPFTLKNMKIEYTD